MKPTDEAKRLRDEIYHVYAFTTEGELSCTDATHAIDADDLPAIINKVLDAAWPDIKIMQQAMFEMKHAQLSGPGWYTRGESGLKQQVRMWIDKGLKASESINKLRP